MNRSIVLVGVAILLSGFALIAFPIATTGQELFDFEQEAGLFFIPPAMAVLLVGAISDDPRVTTVGGAFGNPDEIIRRPVSPRPAAEAATSLAYHPNEPVGCRHCSTIMAADLARCPRCSRHRECRSCGRPLGVVVDKVTCPTCARPEAFCNCPRFPSRVGTSDARGRRV